MDAGLLDWMMNALNGAVSDALTALLPLVYIILGVCVLLAVVMTLLVVLAESSLLVLWAILKILLGWSIITVAILTWQPITTLLAATATTAGLAIAGNRLSVDQFMSPGQLAVEGSRITNMMEQWLNTLGYKAALKPHLIISMSLASTFVSTIWILMGMHTLMSVFIFKLLVPVGFLGLAFMIAPSVRWFGFSLVRLLISSTMQLFALAAWSSMLTIIVPKLILTQIADISLWRVTLIGAMTFVLFCITIVVPFLVAAGAFAASGMNLARPLKSMVYRAI